MFETEFKLELRDINQLLPSDGCIYKIYPLIRKPWMWDDLNVLDRDLKVQNRVYFQFRNIYYELVCLRGEKCYLTKEDDNELQKQKEAYLLGGDY